MTISSIAKLYKSLSELRTVMKLFEKYFIESELSESIENLIKEESVDAIDYLIYTIEDIFDTTQLTAKAKGSSIIKEGVSKELDYKRQQITALDELLDEANKSIQNKLGFRPKKVFKHFSSFKTILIPQFGYHVEIKLK